jgi:hypothetical protein
MAPPTALVRQEKTLHPRFSATGVLKHAVLETQADVGQLEWCEGCLLEADV